MTAHIPFWVFPLLALLVTLGIVQSRPRWVPPRRLVGIALGLGVTSLWGVSASFGAHAVPLLLWAAGMGVALTIGWLRGPSAGMRFDAVERRVHLPGSWLPLALMLGIFGIKFGLGAAAGLGHPVQPGTLAAAGCALALGLLSGGFAARAQSVLTVAHRAA